jgi:hypothetical protein
MPKWDCAAVSFHQMSRWLACHISICFGSSRPFSHRLIWATSPMAVTGVSTTVCYASFINICSLFLSTCYIRGLLYLRIERDCFKVGKKFVIMSSYVQRASQSVMLPEKRGMHSINTSPQLSLNQHHDLKDTYLDEITTQKYPKHVRHSNSSV